MSLKVPQNVNMNLNSFVSRKTVSQGMLDLALLTANAAQLKRVLNNGPGNKFYNLLVTMIILSMVLQVCFILIFDQLFKFSCPQVFQAVLICLLAIYFDLNKVEEHRRTNITNNILLMATIISVSVNIVISTFDIAEIK